MSWKRLAFVGLVLLVAVVLWLSRAGFSPPSNATTTSAGGPKPGATPNPAPDSPLPSASTASANPRAGTSSPGTASPAAALLNAPSSDIRADLRALDEIIATFRSNFLRTGNPVGNNAEITAALTGKNKLQLVFIPPDHPAINAQGELCDRWGTPFFFHAESARRMEIRSAGPDRKMWNEDDVVFAP